MRTKIYKILPYLKIIRSKIYERDLFTAQPKEYLEEVLFLLETVNVDRDVISNPLASKL